MSPRDMTRRLNSQIFDHFCLKLDLDLDNNDYKTLKEVKALAYLMFRTTDTQKMNLESRHKRYLDQKLQR